MKTSFFISAVDVSSMLRRGGMTEDELLRSLIVPASKLARPYISRYFVGCATAQLCSISIARSRCHLTASFCMNATAQTSASALSAGRAVGLGNSGSVYFGVNIEFPGVPLNQSVRDRSVNPPHLGLCHRVRHVMHARSLILYDGHGNGRLPLPCRRITTSDAIALTGECFIWPRASTVRGWL